MKSLTTYINKMRGGKSTQSRVPLNEIFWSAVGAFFGIYLIYGIGHYQALHIEDSLFLVGSFGASAVLLYGVPNSPLSQPRNLVGGHVVSALVGVSCALWFVAYPEIAGALSVSLAIVVMHITKTVHPPGGATALIAVIGSDHIHNMKYLYVLSPILLGACIMLVVALIVNNLSSSRHYPLYWN